VAQSVGPEFKPQYRKKERKRNIFLGLRKEGAMTSTENTGGQTGHSNL
jgi:hypothetical protein